MWRGVLTDPNCPKCLGLGYVVKGEGEFAQAEVCDCSKHCEICGDLGYLIEFKDNYPVAKKCQCTFLKDRIKSFNNAKIPARYALKTIEHYNPQTRLQRDVKDYLLRYRDEFLKGAKGVLLYGGTGVGKTHLVVGLIRYLTLERGFSARFVEFFHLLQEIKAAFSEGLSEADILKPLVLPDILVIDELGKGRGSEWERDVLDSLISDRYNAGKTIFATTNFSVDPADPNGLHERVGKRVMSRLWEMCEFFQVDGPDYRVR